METQTPDVAKFVVETDGDKLAEALRRVTPFMAEKGREDLAAVYAESDGTTLQLTATDGFRMAHLTVMVPFPTGNYLLEADGIKDFSQRHYNGGKINVACFVVDTLQMGDVQVKVVQKPYVNYPAIVPDVFDVEAIVDTKAWIKAIRGSGADRVGIVFSKDGCKMYSQDKDGETIGCNPLPVQMYNGPDVRLTFKADHFRRALTSCGPSATIQVNDPNRIPEGKTNPALLEAADYWHLIIPLYGFPTEVTLGPSEKAVLDLAEETIKNVKKGAVPAKVMFGGGKLYIEVNPAVIVTQVLVQEPVLKEATPEANATPEQA